MLRQMLTIAILFSTELSNSLEEYFTYTFGFKMLTHCRLIRHGNISSLLERFIAVTAREPVKYFH